MTSPLDPASRRHESVIVDPATVQHCDDLRLAARFCSKPRDASEAAPVCLVDAYLGLHGWGERSATRSGSHEADVTGEMPNRGHTPDKWGQTHAAARACSMGRHVHGAGHACFMWHTMAISIAPPHCP